MTHCARCTSTMIMDDDHNLQCVLCGHEWRDPMHPLPLDTLAERIAANIAAGIYGDVSGKGRRGRPRKERVG